MFWFFYSVEKKLRSKMSDITGKRTTLLCGILRVHSSKEVVHFRTLQRRYNYKGVYYAKVINKI